MAKSKYIQDTLEKWLPRLIDWNRIGHVERESDLLLKMDQILDELKSQKGHPPE